MRKQTAYWVTKNRGPIRICDMEDSHLTNTIKMLEQLAPDRISQLLASMYCTAGWVSGDMASWYIDRDIDRLESITVEEFLISEHPMYERLILDAERRGLELERKDD